MDTYSFQGHYHYNGKTGKFNGQLEVNDTQVSGPIRDFGSIVKNQRLEGKVVHLNGSARLLFVKMPGRRDLANLLYDVTCSKHTNLCGTYTGSWRALPIDIDLDEFAQALGVRCTDDMRHVLRFMPQCTTPQRAELIVTPKAAQ